MTVPDTTVPDVSVSDTTVPDVSVSGSVDPRHHAPGPTDSECYPPAPAADSDGLGFWAQMERRGPRTVLVDGTRIAEGSRVRLRPRAHTDIFDLALDGRLAIVESVEQDDDGNYHLAVTLEDDPGRDLGDARLPGHRFFYSLADVAPLPTDASEAPRRRILVAGIGNVFLGDDGFGPEVIRGLAESRLPAGVDVVDFGIRGMDLAYALHRGYQDVIFVDASPRGESPGTLSLLEPDRVTDGAVSVAGHGMDPVSVLRLARELGDVPARIRVLCCEPATVHGAGPDEDVLVELSEPVRASIGPAVAMIESLAVEWTVSESNTRDNNTEKSNTEDGDLR